jgi:hypothetical protein
MQRSLTLALLLAASAATAAPQPGGIANMRAWCDCVMAGGVCRQTNSPPLAAGEKVWTVLGPIPAETVNAYRADPMMCQRGAQACSDSWDGTDCKAFRIMFRQTPMTCVAPGEPRGQ